MDYGSGRAEIVEIARKIELKKNILREKIRGQIENCGNQIPWLL